MNINEKTRKALLRFQQNEITESLLYTQLAAIEKDPSNKEVLLQIANDEKGHYTILKKYTGQEISPNKLRVTKYYWLARILGITFAIKLMEGSEESAKNDYASYDEYPDLQQIARDEDEHEQRLIALINEERLEYMGSVVLGLNDALVEFTGALAGFTLAVSDSRLIALTGSITGIAAALSMASSEYLSTKSENGNENGKQRRYPLLGSAAGWKYTFNRNAGSGEEYDPPCDPFLLQRRYAAARNPGREEIVSGLLFPLCRFLDHLRGSEGGWLVYGT